MDEINAIEERLQSEFSIDKIDINSVSTNLSKNMRNKLYYTTEPFRTFVDCTISENFSTKNLRETLCKKCVFSGANLKATGFAGSLFIETSFFSCEYNDTNFQSAEFRKCLFENALFEYTRYNKSFFTDTVFHNCTFISVSMCDCKFINCTFSNCKWMPVSIENTLFKDTCIKDTIFKSMNFEFATFENIHTENLKLPFPTIPYIYNGLVYLQETTDNIRVTSAAHANGISKDEYLSYIPELKKYYIYTQNYFPLCNIFASNKQYEQALICITKGLELSVIIRRFRMLVNLCKMLKYITIVTAHTRQEVYLKLMNIITNANLSELEQDNLSLYLPNISNILLDEGNTSKINILIYMDTLIENNDAEKIGEIYSIIDDLLTNNCAYSVQIRHNSPISVIIQIFSDPKMCESIVSAINMAFIGIQTFYYIKNNQLQKESNKIQAEQLSNNNDDFYLTENKCENEKSTLEKKGEKARHRVKVRCIKVRKTTVQIDGKVYVYTNKDLK